jgi:hypothetical protein
VRAHRRSAAAAVLVAFGVTAVPTLSDAGSSRPAGPAAAGRSPASPAPDAPTDDVPLVGAADPLATLFRATALRGWRESAVAGAVRAHAVLRGRPTALSGVPAADVTDRPADGTTYLASSRPDGSGLVVRVSERTRFIGWERVALGVTRELTLRPDTVGRPVVVADRPLGQRDLWDLTPLRGVRAGAALVVGDAPAPVLHRLAQVGAVAVPSVTLFWGRDWAQRVVIVAPDSLEEFAEQLGRRPAVSGAFAAVTTGRGPESGPDAPGPDTFVGSRVYINPAAWAELAPVGQRIVVTHETTHVAAQAASRPGPPTWLAEGVADQVGFSGSGIPERAEVGAVLDEVRRSGPPAALPGADEFSGDSPGVGAEAYAGADVAVQLIVRRYGLATLREMFRDATLQARAGAPPDAALAFAFHVDLHTTVASFTASWRAELRRLASG